MHALIAATIASSGVRPATKTVAQLLRQTVTMATVAAVTALLQAARNQVAGGG